MYLLGLGLLVLSTWYLIKLYDGFTNDPLAKKEMNEAWEQAKKEAVGKNPFAKGRIQSAIENYKKSVSEKNISK